MAGGAQRQQQALDAFTASIKANAQEQREQINKCVRAVASDIGEALVVGNEFGPGTPIDWGFARAMWYVTMGAEGEESGGNPNPPEEPPHGPGGAEARRAGRMEAGSRSQAAMTAIAVAAAAVQLGDTVSFVNEAAYIERLNDGWSQQAPAGMTDAVEANFTAIVDRSAARFGLKT